MSNNPVRIEPDLLDISTRVVAEQLRLRDGTGARGECRLLQALGARQVAE